MPRFLLQQEALFLIIALKQVKKFKLRNIIQNEEFEVATINRLSRNKIPNGVPHGKFVQLVDQPVYLNFQKHQDVLTLNLTFIRIFHFLYQTQSRGLLTFTILLQELNVSFFVLQGLWWRMEN